MEGAAQVDSGGTVALHTSPVKPPSSVDALTIKPVLVIPQELGAEVQTLPAEGVPPPLLTSPHPLLKTTLKSQLMASRIKRPRPPVRKAVRPMTKPMKAPPFATM